MPLVRCPECHTVFDSFIPPEIEPMFTLVQAASIIPMVTSSLRSFLRSHREIPVRYRQDRRHRRHRMLCASEIRYIRDHLVKAYYPGTNQLVAIARSDEFDPTLYPTIDWSKRV
jgi:hypothetical protein